MEKVNCSAKKRLSPGAFVAIVVAILTALSSAGVFAANSFNVTKAGQGKAVILIPGLMSNSSVWQQTAAQLQRNYQVHQLSLAGFAGQPAIEDFSLTKVKAELATYIQQQDLDKPIVIGHSLGGFLAMSMAIDYPNVVGDIISVDGLPFIGPIFTQTNDTKPVDLSQQAKQLLDMHQTFTTEHLSQQAQRGVFIQATAPEDQARVIDMAGQSDPKTVGQAIFELMQTDLRPKLGAIQSRLMLIGAAGAFHDTNGQNRAQAIYAEQLALAPNAKLVMTNSARHFIMFDDPSWLNQQIAQFIGQ